MYTYTIIYNEQSVSQDSNNAAHTLRRRTAARWPYEHPVKIVLIVVSYFIMQGQL